MALAGPGFPPITLPAALNAYTAYILAGFADARPDLDVDGVLTRSANACSSRPPNSATAN